MAQGNGRPPAAPPGEATRVLKASGGGDADASERLMAIVYDELRALAAHHMRFERVNHTLQPTALVNEAFLRLINQDDATWNDRAHFITVASQTIRRILVDHARSRATEKRGGDPKRVDLDHAAGAETPPVDLDILALDEALDDLGALNERQRRIVELRHFGGLTIDETAEALGVSPSTVKVEWAMARAWLFNRLNAD